MRINTNINSMRTQEYMRQNQAKMSNAMDRLSSGKRINNASDDAAGLAIATRMRARESGLNVAANNTQDGMALIRTADSAMNSVSNILLRMRDIANQSANGTNTDKNQAALQKEFAELQKQIDYIAGNTQFNDKNLLDGSNKSINIQTLDSADQTKQISIDLKSATLDALGIKDLNVGATENTLAKATITAKDAFDAAKVASDAAKQEITDAASTTPSKNDAQLAKEYIDAKEALEALKPGDGDYATKSGELDAATKALNTNAKALVDGYEKKLTTTKAKEADYKAAAAQSDKSSVAANLVTNYTDAKTLALGNDIAKNYLEAKTAYEANKTDITLKSKFEAAETELNKDIPANKSAKDLVETYEKAKAAGTNEKSLVAVEKIDEALKTIADNRATLGATLNRLDFNVNNLKSQSSAMAASASQIEDADMAKEMSEMTKFKILNEAGISMLSQANQTPQMVSKLLQ
ncbi:flagellin [Bacillus paranthracis]|uniref:flagellin N-terminal helical domain-containing protein n=1 Tax=Bacillus paranthracis TaxID=2026186 RepID=UPI002E2207A6|nr:flagellin [Bacillus paranthracis]MED1680597.1 flagellin [Bacillus paranthracis]